MKKLSILLAFAICLSGCGKTDNVPENQNVLIPIKPGNKWVYQLTYYLNTEGVVDTAVHFIGEKLTINGTTGYIFNNGKAPFDATFLLNNDPGGNVLSIGGCSTADTLISSSVLFKINAMKGDSWESASVILHAESGTFEEKIIEVKCINSDTLLSVPKGDFKCKVFEYSTNSGSGIRKYYISNNIGIIKTEQFEGSKLFTKEVLIDYKF